MSYSWHSGMSWNLRPQSKNKAASHRIHCIVKVFETNEPIFPLIQRCKKTAFWAASKDILWFRYLGDKITASTFRYHDRDRFRFFIVWLGHFSLVQNIANCDFFHEIANLCTWICFRVEHAWSLLAKQATGSVQAVSYQNILPHHCLLARLSDCLASATVFSSNIRLPKPLASLSE